MGIFMDNIDFNECLKKKKELEKEAESTAPEEVREEKVEEKKRKEISKVYSSMDGNSAYYDTASYARVYQTRAGFHTPIFILVTSRQRRVITHASNYLQTDGQLKLAAVFFARR